MIIFLGNNCSHLLISISTLSIYKSYDVCVNFHDSCHRNGKIYCSSISSGFTFGSYTFSSSEIVARVKFMSRHLISFDSYCTFNHRK